MFQILCVQRFISLGMNNEPSLPFSKWHPWGSNLEQGYCPDWSCQCGTPDFEGSDILTFGHHSPAQDQFFPHSSCLPEWEACVSASTDWLPPLHSAIQRRKDIHAMAKYIIIVACSLAQMCKPQGHGNKVELEEDETCRINQGRAAHKYCFLNVTTTAL